MTVSTSTFVAIRARETHWGVHAKLVKSIVSERDWSGARPFEMAEALGVSVEQDDSPHPILVLATDEGSLPFRAFGRLLFRQLDVASVLPVPMLVRCPGKRQPVTGIAFQENGPPLVVLDWIALLAAAREGTPG